MKSQQPGYGAACPDGGCLPAHVPSGPALLALALGEQARGIKGLDVLRRSVDRAPPALGQHTDEVLAEMGFTAPEIAAFRAAGIILGE